jgi:hypothetical protein
MKKLSLRRADAQGPVLFWPARAMLNEHFHLLCASHFNEITRDQMKTGGLSKKTRSAAESTEQQQRARRKNLMHTAAFRNSLLFYSCPAALCCGVCVIEGENHEHARPDTKG